MRVQSHKEALFPIKGMSLDGEVTERRNQASLSLSIVNRSPVSPTVRGISEIREHADLAYGVPTTGTVSGRSWVLENLEAIDVWKTIGPFNIVLEGYTRDRYSCIIVVGQVKPEFSDWMRKTAKMSLVWPRHPAG
ncbi:hypothetical protein [Arthrobacter alkaliphilus]|uniref:hypothetical protein n=1 Tax=Arthrobacter alkaliphilus TaxID=369936 RepID=UPI001F457C84|nr:hypothetical protein [Arthrobacter alkaliphilus]